MTEYRIREARADELDALMPLWRQLEIDQGPYRLFPLGVDAEERVRAQLHDALRAPRNKVLVADADGRLLGMAVAAYAEREHSGDAMAVIDLSRVVVVPDARNLGIGDALVRAAEDFGRALGARYLQAHLFSGNEAGRRFWENRGFVPRFEARVRPISGDPAPPAEGAP